MAPWQALCVLWLLPLRLTLASQEVENYSPCVVKNSKSGVTVVNNYLEDGVYQFACDGAWSEHLYFRAQIVKQDTYVRVIILIDNVSESDDCRGRIEVTVVSSPLMTGQVDLCRKSPFPETFQSSLEVRMRPLSTFVRSKFIVHVEHERKGPQTLDATLGWRHLSSVGYPRSYPNFMNVTYTIATHDDLRVIELLFEDISLEHSVACNKDYVEVSEDFVTPMRWCRDPLHLYSKGSKVKVRFVTDGHQCGRGFRLKYRAKERKELPGAVVELSGTVNWLFIPCYVAAIFCLACVCIRLCGHRHLRLLSVVPMLQVRVAGGALHKR